MLLLLFWESYAVNGINVVVVVVVVVVVFAVFYIFFLTLAHPVGVVKKSLS